MLPRVTIPITALIQRKEQQWIKTNQQNKAQLKIKIRTSLSILTQHRWLLELDQNIPCKIKKLTNKWMNEFKNIADEISLR